MFFVSNPKAPGNISNYYHRQYSLEVFNHRDTSLRQIDKMSRDGEAIINIGAGFHDRNSQVALSDIVLAFTFGEGDTPLADSGTYDTWIKAQKNGKELHHISLKGIS
jgi:putative N-acetylmannosamine-6-phosphate epimerase